jgi:Glycine-zipper domain
MKKTIGIFLAIGLLTSCAGMSDTEQRAFSGTAIGAGGGAIVGAISGNTAMGAVIGAGAGLIGGLVVDKVEKDKEAAYQRGYTEGQAN